MKVSLDPLNKKVVSQLKLIGQEAERLGFTAYLVGGVVRDLLLKRPSSDWDIVVEGDAIELAKTIASAAKAKMTAYEQFGTATLNFSDGTTIDFVTARSEHYPQPGALPVVKAGTIKDDLLRRDFSVNAMAVILNPQNFGELLDLYGGLPDLQQRKIHILHDKSFVDDPTRILRAVRFEVRFGFKIGNETLRLLKAALKSYAASTVKSPRYFAEFRKFFSEKDPAAGLKRLSGIGGLSFIEKHFRLPIKTLIKVQKTILSLKKKAFYKSYDWSAVYLISVFSQSTAGQVARFAKEFHLTAKEQASLRDLANVAGIVRQLRAARLKLSRIYETLDPVDLEIIYFIRTVTSVNIVASRIDEFLQKSRLVALGITGEDLKRLGLKPGRDMGALLHTLLLKKIDGEIRSRQDEITLAKRLGFEHFPSLIA